MPSRSAGRQRLYSDADVERLALLARATAHGRAIGQLARLEGEELRALVAEDDAMRGATALGAGERSDADAASDARIIETALSYIEAFDAVRFEHLLRAESLRRGTDETTDQIIVPLLTAIGDRWHAGTLNPAHEHLASAAVRRVLGWMFTQATTAETAPTVIVATPAGQLHELGAMLAAVAATARGWRVVYLGANLPAHDIAGAAVRARVRAIALSIVHPALDDAAIADIRALRRDVPHGVRIVLGGTGALASRHAVSGDGVDIVEDLHAWRAWLGDAAHRIAFAT